MTNEDLRRRFPVLERVAYLNAGTDGPLAAEAARAGARELGGEAERGRTREHFERRGELGSALREAYARALRCEAAEVALTTCTSEGLSIVIEGLGLRSGDEILTSDEEHPGLLGALASARDLYGVSVRMAPLQSIDQAVGRDTRLVACCHVGWMSGLLAPAGLGELAELGVPVVLDGAQGVGAVDVDVRALRCDAYAGAGQKWLCGPDGTGMLYVAPSLRERLCVRRRGYGNLADPGLGIDAPLHDDARRFDTLALSAEALAVALAATGVLEDFGWERVYERSRSLASVLVERLRERGRDVARRDQTTLVSFASADAEAERDVLAAAGVLLRNIPGRPWLRASVGAWNDESDIDRLLAGLAR
ncbi:MAG TPA: aminotransferase class V-fold PLP-dependent enzyme [Solirubrobacteraceae bacterium]|jgi:L-cysteine/cystine lyase|nr:aminotransferase class V-fold PLP-dependent enzyme [Solirubrobacteraceae bacterium]